ncbi:MAG: methyltransferase domain-containing protein [Zavarzinella sp.]|nr:methyltransferase domain-containing protein [Zavarzinella sp.]
MLRWNPNTLVIPLGGGLFRLFQVSARRNLLATRPVVDLIDRLVPGLEEADFERACADAGSELRVADATTFTLWDHAYQNSDMFDRTAGADHLTHLAPAELAQLLEECGMAARSWPPPNVFPKRGFADRHRGSFYEQIATECLYNRDDPTRWWTRQKFAADYSEVRPTPYRFIEERFLTGYFRDHFARKAVLDVGCGTGYFTAKMARHARRVVGVDYNREYVALARGRAPLAEYPNLDFQVGDIIDLSAGRPGFAAEQFDYVVLIDTFLFLFDRTYQRPLYDNRRAIVANLRRLLGPDGVLVLFDPHPLWLCPWVGSADAPFGILTEYRHRSFKVIPCLEEYTGLLYDSGLRVRRVLEPGIDDEYRAVDPQAHAFMAEVPQWWCFEAERGEVHRRAVSATGCD